jgi:hypothetical protein
MQRGSRLPSRIGWSAEHRERAEVGVAEAAPWGVARRVGAGPTEALANATMEEAAERAPPGMGGRQAPHTTVPPFKACASIMVVAT